MDYNPLTSNPLQRHSYNSIHAQLPSPIKRDPKAEKVLENRKSLYEKQLRRLKHYKQTINTEGDRLMSVGMQLNRNSMYLIDSKDHLENIIKIITSNNIILSQKIETTKNSIIELKQKSDEIPVKRFYCFYRIDTAN